VAVGEVDGRPVAVTGSKDGTVRVWDLWERRGRVIEVEAETNGLALAARGVLAVATSSGVAVIQLLDSRALANPTVEPSNRIIMER
jgi:hypothetical protein